MREGGKRERERVTEQLWRQYVENGYIIICIARSGNWLLNSVQNCSLALFQTLCIIKNTILTLDLPVPSLWAVEAIRCSYSNYDRVEVEIASASTILLLSFTGVGGVTSTGTFFLFIDPLGNRILRSHFVDFADPNCKSFTGSFLLPLATVRSSRPFLLGWWVWRDRSSSSSRNRGGSVHKFIVITPFKNIPTRSEPLTNHLIALW